jgi:hypothetical protein
MKRKIIYVDVGTHVGQEYDALFKHSTTKMMWLFLKLFFATLIYPNRKIKYIGFFEALIILKNVKALRHRRADILTIVVEPNARLFNHSVYSNADKVFCLALTGVNSQIEFQNLYFPNSNKASQGASIFENKKGIDTGEYDTVVTVGASYFTRMLRETCDAAYAECGYTLVLRVNCEGFEDSAIYAFKREFGNAFTLVMGSLKDVGELKGQRELDTMNAFIKSENLDFVPFTPLYHTWKDASRAILKLMD